MNYLIDTNLISELAKKQPNAYALNWLAQQDRETLFLSTITFGEIAKGVARNSLRQQQIEDWFRSIIQTWFAGRIIHIDEEIAMYWGNLVGSHKRTLPAIDAFLAATALVHRLTLVTRNTKDFSDIPSLRVLNPFEA